MRIFTHVGVIVDCLAAEVRLRPPVLEVCAAHKVPQAPLRSPICATGRGDLRVSPASECLMGTGNARGGRGRRKSGELDAEGRRRGKFDQAPKVPRRRLGGCKRAAGSLAANRRRVLFDLLPAADLCLPAGASAGYRGLRGHSEVVSRAAARQTLSVQQGLELPGPTTAAAPRQQPACAPPERSHADSKRGCPPSLFFGRI